MNKIKYFMIMLITVITFASCSTTFASTQQYDDDTYTTVSTTVDFSTVVMYGTPYYIDNVLSYYLYRGIYYYPYRYNNYWYFYPSHYMRPRGFVYHYNPGYRHYMRPAPRGYEFRRSPMKPSRPNNFGKPDMRQNKPGGSRPSFGNGQRPNNKHNVGNPQRPQSNSRPNFNQCNMNRRPNVFGSRPSSTRITQGQGRPSGNFNQGSQSRGHFGGRR